MDVRQLMPSAQEKPPRKGVTSVSDVEFLVDALEELLTSFSVQRDSR
jgi:hypothetical protein